MVPVYAAAGCIDNVNFSAKTIWEGAVREGQTFVYDRAHLPGRQFILEAVDLAPIPDSSYDFVLSSHTLEHIANPLRALREWMRVLRSGGILILVVPHHADTFDRRRPVTTLAHLIDDDRNGVGEDDLTHLPEILELHDLALDPPAGEAAAFRARSERNEENRCLHHHVFDEALVAALLETAGFQQVAVERQPPHHVIAVAR
jgi:SAM-dependent methyltransferase